VIVLLVRARGAFETEGAGDTETATDWPGHEPSGGDALLGATRELAFAGGVVLVNLVVAAAFIYINYLFIRWVVALF
jgi:hypothetical protein